MHFETFKVRMEKAAAAARDFKGFDGMAEKDEYLKTDSLNVRKRPQNSNDSVRASDKEMEERPAVIKQIALEEDADGTSILPSSNRRVESSNSLQSLSKSQTTSSNTDLRIENQSADDQELEPKSTQNTFINHNINSSHNDCKEKNEVYDLENCNLEQEKEDPKINIPDNLFANKTEEWSLLDMVLSPDASTSQNSITIRGGKNSENKHNNKSWKSKKTENYRVKKVTTSDYSVFSHVQTLMKKNAEPLQHENMSNSYNDLLGGNFDSDDEKDDIFKDILKKGETQNDGIKKVPSDKNNKRKDNDKSTFFHNDGKNGQDKTSSRKDPNRFFSDLENRLSTIPLDKEQASQNRKTNNSITKKNETETSPLSFIGSFAAAENKVSWLRAVTSPGIQFAAKAFSPRASNQSNDTKSSMNSYGSNFEHKQFRNENDCGEEPDITIASSALLGSDEMAELERIRHNSKNELVSLCSNYVAKNRNFIFVGFTLTLAIFVYFYSRKRTIIDIR